MPHQATRTDSAQPARKPGSQLVEYFILLPQNVKRGITHRAKPGRTALRMRESDRVAVPMVWAVKKFAFLP